MFDKFGEAFSLLFKNIWLFSAIVLTVWLPGNIILMLVTKFAGEENFMAMLHAMVWLEAIFSPLYIGALIHALARIKSGNTVTYKEAMAAGFKSWFRLFAVRFVTGIFIGIGFLILIVPGVILALRYALVDCATVLEGKRLGESMDRSIALTTGRRWEILGAMLLLFMGLVILAILVYFPIGFIEGLMEAMELSVTLAPVEIVVDCAMSVVYLVIPIVLFLYYWEAMKEKPDAGASAGGTQQVPA